MNLWLDDFRKPDLQEPVLVFTCAEQLIQHLSEHDYDAISLYLDHDLGEGKSGYDFCKWFLEYNFDKQIPMRFHLLTANPVGAFNMRQLLTHYGYEEF